MSPPSFFFNKKFLYGFKNSRNNLFSVVFINESAGLLLGLHLLKQDLKETDLQMYRILNTL